VRQGFICIFPSRMGCATSKAGPEHAPPAVPETPKAIPENLPNGKGAEPAASQAVAAEQGAADAVEIGKADCTEEDGRPAEAHDAAAAESENPAAWQDAEAGDPSVGSEESLRKQAELRAEIEQSLLREQALKAKIEKIKRKQAAKAGKKQSKQLTPLAQVEEEDGEMQLEEVEDLE